MVTGNGYAPLSESMPVMGISTMTKAAFISAEQHIGSWWWELLQESMKIAGEEDRALAIANNSYHQGVPAITVIVDGRWCKRTHRHTYNAKSGVGIIIGKQTGKLLFIGFEINFATFVVEQITSTALLQNTNVS